MRNNATTSPADKVPSAVELLREIDRFIRDSSFGVDYEVNGYAAMVEKVLQRAERRKAAKLMPPRPDQLSFHLGKALEAMKASDPYTAAFIDQMENILNVGRHQ